MMNIDKVGWEIETDYPQVRDLRDDVLDWLKGYGKNVDYTSDASIHGYEYRFLREVDWWLSDDFVKFAHEFPYYVRQEDDCGNHLHFSFIAKGFYNAVLENIFSLEGIYIEMAYRSARSKFLSRLYSQFTRLVTHENFEVWDNNRYYFANLDAYQKHGTLEIRILPYFETSDEIIKWIRGIIKSVNAMTKTEIKTKTFDNFTLTGKWIYNKMNFSTISVRYFGREDFKIKAFENNLDWAKISSMIKPALESAGIKVFADDFHEVPFKDGAINLAIFRIKDFYVPLIPSKLLNTAVEVVDKALTEVAIA